MARDLTQRSHRAAFHVSGNPNRLPWFAPKTTAHTVSLEALGVLVVSQGLLPVHPNLVKEVTQAVFPCVAKDVKSGFAT